jgi:hypothetical protein
MSFSSLSTLSTFTTLLVATVVSSAGCGKSDDGTAKPAPTSPKAPIAPAVEPAPAPPPIAPVAETDTSKNRITISVDKANAPQRGTASRCAIDGAPITSNKSISLSIAATANNTLYIAEGEHLRRYQKTDDADCKLKLDTTFGDNGILAAPKAAAKPQQLKGTVYLRSGDPEWKVAIDQQARVYLYDFLLGVYRVDKGKTVPVCAGMPGIKSLAFAKGGPFVVRDGVESIELKGKCKTKQLVKSALSLFSVADSVWVQTGSESIASLAGDTLGTTIKSVDAFEPGGFCSVSSVAACGKDRLCVVDNNCKKIAVFESNGTFAAELKRGLFAQSPYGLSAGASGEELGLWLGATYKADDVYEASVLLVPASEL